MKKSLVVIAAALAGVMVAGNADAQTRRRTGTAVSAKTGAQATVSPRAKVYLDGNELRKIIGKNAASLLSSPALPGASTIGRCNTKDRKWIVLESKFETFPQWTDRLTATWHVLLDTSTLKEKEKDADGKLVKVAQYSYFSTTVTYMNIPKGLHATSVCLPPSYYERYGAPMAVGVVITNPEGEILAGDSASEIRNLPSHQKWWEDSKIMDARNSAGDPMIERRQGLVDRSKTIWAFVNPNDYEVIAQ